MKPSASSISLGSTPTTRSGEVIGVDTMEDGVVDVEGRTGFKQVGRACRFGGRTDGVGDMVAREGDVVAEETAGKF